MNLRLYAIGGAVILLLATATWALAERGGRIAAEAREAQAMEAAQANQRAVEQIREERAQAIAALSGLAQDIAARAARTIAVRRAIDAAPTTTACVESPAVRAALDGLRRASDPGAGGAPGDPGRVARVPAAAGAAGGDAQRR